MLELRPCCEHCGKGLPANSAEAMICSFECTYCRECALGIFEDVCPSCEGNFVPRPIRPKAKLIRYPMGTKMLYMPKDLAQLKEQQERLKKIKPSER